jgi:dihydroflavonol-4-reductase
VKTKKMVQVIVTGASGYIAIHVCKLAAQAGHKVRGTVRSKDNAIKCQPVLDAVPGIELVEADLLDDKGWAEAVRGCEYVFHLASPFPIKTPSDENDLIRPAVDGTLRVLKAAAAEPGVKRVILTSSVAAVSAGHAKTATLPASESAQPGKVWSEEDWSRAEGCEAYAKSKTLAEQERIL